MSAKVLKAACGVEVHPLPIPSFGEVPAAEASPLSLPRVDRTSAMAAAAAAHALAPEPEAIDPENIVEVARREAARIIAEAEESRSIIHQAAVEQARLDVEAAIESEVDARVGDLRERFADSIEKVASISNELTGAVESDIVELAIQIAKKVVRREVTIDRDIALTLVRVSLAKLHQRTSVEVHLHPEDLAFISNRLDSIEFRGPIRLVEDISISPGGCLVHTETGDIDARIESQFDEIAHGLLN